MRINTTPEQEQLRQEVYDIFNEHDRNIVCKSPCPGVTATVALIHQREQAAVARFAERVRSYHYGRASQYLSAKAVK